MPFLIGFSNACFPRVRAFVQQSCDPGRFVYSDIAKEKLFLIDPCNHTDRIAANCLIISGEKDTQCPVEDILSFYNSLNCNKKYIELAGREHGYTKEFEEATISWIKKYIS